MGSGAEGGSSSRPCLPAACKRPELAALLREPVRRAASAAGGHDGGELRRVWCSSR